MSHTYRVLFDDGKDEWVTVDDEKDAPEVGGTFEVEATIVRTVVRVDDPDAPDTVVVDGVEAIDVDPGPEDEVVEKDAKPTLGAKAK